MFRRKKSATRGSKYDTFGGQHCAQNWVKHTRIHICTCNSHRYPEHSPQDKSSLLSCSRDTPIYFHIRLHLALLASLPALYYLLAQVRLSWTDPSWELLFVPLVGCSTAGWYSEFGLTLWQYGLLSFQAGDTKLERFLPLALFDTFPLHQFSKFNNFL